jgi:D-3-phosphoglycerate dehydrogenase
MRILITDPADDSCRSVLQKEGFDVDLKPDIPYNLLRTIISEYDALIVRSGTRVSSQIVESAPKLRVIDRAGAGVDNINVDAATPRGVIAMNAPGRNNLGCRAHAVDNGRTRTKYLWGC